MDRVNGDEGRASACGTYVLGELLARGGMADLFKSKLVGVEGFEKSVVIKRIRDDLGRDPDFIAMLIDEARVAVTLSHANIVQVLDLGRIDDGYFIAMEYVAGADLSKVRNWARRCGRAIPIEMSVFIVSEVAKALDYAHRRCGDDGKCLNIVHRDVSPQNVLVSSEGEVRLTDFGISKARNAMHAQTQVGVLKGKYVYMSPEQACGDPVDSRTDVFALGIVLYELIAGMNPFRSDSPHETLRRVRVASVPTLESVAANVPTELAEIVRVAMAWNPDARYRTAGILCHELVQWLHSVRSRVGSADVAKFLAEVRGESERPALLVAPDGDASEVDSSVASSRRASADAATSPSRPRVAGTSSNQVSRGRSNGGLIEHPSESTPSAWTGTRPVPDRPKSRRWIALALLALVVGFLGAYRVSSTSFAEPARRALPTESVVPPALIRSDVNLPRTA